MVMVPVVVVTITGSTTDCENASLNVIAHDPAWTPVTMYLPALGPAAIVAVPAQGTAFTVNEPM